MLRLKRGALRIDTKEGEEGRAEMEGESASSIREQRPESSKVADLTSCKVRGVFKQKRFLGLGIYFATGCGVRDVWDNCKQELLCPY